MQAWDGIQVGYRRIGINLYRKIFLRKTEESFLRPPGLYSEHKFTPPAVSFKIQNGFTVVDIKKEISGFYGAFLLLRSYSARDEIIFLSLTYNPLTVSLSSSQLLNAEC